MYRPHRSIDERKRDYNLMSNERKRDNNLISNERKRDNFMNNERKRDNFMNDERTRDYNLMNEECKRDRNLISKERTRDYSLNFKECKRNNNLDIKDLKKMINGAEEKLNVKADRSILILGSTGSGKSTLLCFLAGLLPTIKRSNGIFQIDFQQNKDSNIVIGHTKASCTAIPISKKIKNNLFWDCPGFCDNTSVSQEIINLYSTKRILASALGYKIVYVIDYCNFSAKRGRGLAEDIQQLSEMFPDNEKLINSLSIVITRTPQITIQDIINDLYSFVNTSNDFESLKYLILKLCEKGNIISFRAPLGIYDTDYINNNLRKQIEENIENSSFTKMEVRSSLSPKAREMIESLILLYENKIRTKIINFTDSLAAKFKSERNIEKLTKDKLALGKFASACNTQSFETFKLSLDNLSKYFIGSKSFIDKINNLALKIDFFNCYRNNRSSPINTRSWISPISTAEAKITSRIEQIKAEIAKEKDLRLVRENKDREINEIKLLNEKNLKLMKEETERQMAEMEKRLKREKTNAFINLLGAGFISYGLGFFNNFG